MSEWQQNRTKMTKAKKIKQVLQFGEKQRKKYGSVLRWNRKSRSGNYMRNLRS